MISAAFGIGTIIFGYGVFKSRIESLEHRVKSHDEDDATFHQDLDRKLNAQFRRIDEIGDRCTRIEADASSHLDLTTAEDKFVSKGELALHMKNIDKDIAHLTKNSDVMVGKLEELTKAFSSYMLRELNTKDDL